MAKLSGGGIQMNKNVREKVRAGPPSTNLISARGVSQLGYATGSRMKEAGSYTTENSALPVKQGTAAQVPLGNQLATNVGGGGPGTGRTLYRTGTQAVHGPVVAGNTPQGRSIFAQYPPEVTDKSPLVHKR
jgi:hypothetical protein